MSVVNAVPDMASKRIPRSEWDAERPTRRLAEAIAARVGCPADQRHRPGWARIARHHSDEEPVEGRILLVLRAGVLLDLGGGVCGYADRRDLPMWIPRRHEARHVGRRVEGLVEGLDDAAGVAYVSPRLLALRRVENARGSKRVSGRLLSADLTGIHVDLGGLEAFAPRRELPLEWLLAGPVRGERWRGYVLATGNRPLLSRYGPVQRRDRERARVDRLARLVAESDLVGRILSIDGAGAVVELAGDGLITGFVPKTGVRVPTGRALKPRGVALFRLLRVHTPHEANRQTDVALWPAYTRIAAPAGLLEPPAPR